MSYIELSMLIVIVILIILKVRKHWNDDEIEKVVTTEDTSNIVADKDASRRKTALLVGQIMLGIVFIALTRSAVRREIEKLFTGQYHFTPEVISILAMEVLWVATGIFLIVYGKKALK